MKIVYANMRNSKLNGKTADVPDAEALQLIRTGQARRADESPKKASAVKS